MERMISRRRQPGISGNTLKMIAAFSMFLDHAAVIFLPGSVKALETEAELDRIFGTNLAGEWHLIYVILRFVGRIAFPIFCFLLVEGFTHTSDRKKYAFRLLLFALISEIPFNLMISGRIYAPEGQNVYFTLFIGLMVLMGYEYYAWDYGLQMIVTALGLLAAYILKSDYDAIGVAMILLLHFLRNEKPKQLLAGAALGALESLDNMGGAALAFIPIWRYNGKRGKWNMRYFYWFYPAHILLLVLIKNYILLRFAF